LFLFRNPFSCCISEYFELYLNLCKSSPSGGEKKKKEKRNNIDKNSSEMSNRNISNTGRSPKQNTPFVAIPSICWEIQLSLATFGYLHKPGDFNRFLLWFSTLLLEIHKAGEGQEIKFKGTSLRHNRFPSSASLRAQGSLWSRREKPTAAWRG